MAVIIILAIVALIATPIILDVVDDARISAGKSESNMILNGINNYCATSEMKKQMGTLTSDDIDCSNKTSFTEEEIKKMVNLGNAEILEIIYKAELLWLKVKSNDHIYSLQDNQMIEGDLEKPKLDYSGANKPELLDNMIPVKYDGTNWVYTTDDQKSWYNYDSKEWANAVILNSGVSKNVGDTISEDDIALWYVWIPRYKYQLFNADNGSIEPLEIQITFENGTSSAGTVSCVDAVSGSGDSSETCTNATNGNWYTHPAFTFGTQELTGIWVGKFEISTTDSTCNSSPNSANCNKSEHTITIKPNVSSLRYTTISNLFTAIQGISTTYNLNGDSHMMKNRNYICSILFRYCFF